MNPEDDTIPFWRSKIDHINHSVLDLLNRRIEAAHRIGVIKKRENRPVSDPEREQRIIDELVAQNPGPADNRAVTAVFQSIIRETRRLESEGCF